MKNLIRNLGLIAILGLAILAIGCGGGGGASSSGTIGSTGVGSGGLPPPSSGTWGSNPIHGPNPSQSIGNQTKDVDLQRAAVQQAALDNNAAAVATQYGMNFESARQLVQLSSRMSELANAGTLTDEDRSALAQSALAVGHITNEEAANATAIYMKTGDHRAIDGLMDRAAKAVGMPSSASLRDQILPSLGIVVP